MAPATGAGGVMESYVGIRKQGAVSYVGPDATFLARAVLLRGSLRLYAKHGIVPTRGVTLTKMLSIAKEFTGKNYRSSRAQAQQASEDVSVWVENMKCAMPIKVEI